MTLRLDPEIRQASETLAQRMAGVPLPSAGDWRAMRDYGERLTAITDSLLDPQGQVRRTPFQAHADDGTALGLTWFEPPAADMTGSAVLYIHGGGLIMGSVALFDRLIATYVADSGVPALAVDYRLAPEHPYPVPLDDCHAALTWLVTNASRLGVESDRIGVFGESAGGGLAAGLAMMVHDHDGPPIARQILSYPMLDDRTVVPDPTIADIADWTYADNSCAWHAYLGGRVSIPEYAAPARRLNLRGLPPTYLDVGGIDIFRDENTRFALALNQAGVEVEFHLHPGVPHAAETVAARSDVAQRIFADRVRALRSI